MAAENTKAEPAWMGIARFAVAVVALVAFAGFVAYLLRHTAADDKTWDRYVYLLTGIEAIVFAAVGWLFGREVSRPVIEQAKEAGPAKAEAASEKEKGKSLARAIMATHKAEPKRATRLQAMGAPEAAAAAADMSMLVELAQAHYPDLAD